MVAGLAAMRALDHAAFAHLEQLGDVVREGLERGIAKRDAPICVTGAASLFRIHPMRRVPNDYREAYPTTAGAALMKQLSRFFAENGIVLPNGAAASLSTPMGHADAEFIIDVFNGFLASHVGQLDEIQSRK